MGMGTVVHFQCLRSVIVHHPSKVRETLNSRVSLLQKEKEEDVIDKGMR